jgi:SAM-dependent methyltransferase
MALPDSRYGVDEVYLNTHEYAEPKESFKQLVDLIAASRGDGPLSLLDVGCATGAFLHHVRQRLELSRAAGADIFAPLLDEARRRLPDVEFLELSLTDLAERLAERFDVCTVLGTAVLFDDLDDVVRNVMAVLAPAGSAFFWEPMNRDPVDMLMRYRRSGDDGPWTPGFNMWSIASYERAARRVEPDVAVSVTDFRLPFAVPRGEDPMRSWTIATDEDPHQLVAGTGQLLRFRFLEIKLPDAR